MNKILRFAFVAAFAAVSSLSFAQKTVTFEAGKDKGTGLTIEKEGVTITLSAGKVDDKFSYRLYKDATTTITSSAANITNVAFVCDTYKAGGKSYLGDGFDSSMAGLTISADKINVTWTGDKNSVEFKTPGHQVRVKKITVTLKNDPTGINEVSNSTVNANAPIYNLAGQRVGKDYRGVVIQNGKKFIKK
ncbi:hypothetical protein [Prevotella melaninogenica]|uniref:Lipocalin-like domain-containing protein n=1 Tax=Prevotella melaninogenica TaxID=28132 RepID=A0A250KH42_9BACT|nr:hypothetical protein [Prevotella melaninogenica]BBA28988.1 hypothetical protein PMEL1_00908 [Prevotella melaninogenica]